MTKENVIKFRDKIFKGMPMVIVCDNDHNFFDNYPGRTFPVWDDANECVTWLETYSQQRGGAYTNDYPFSAVVTEYAQIQSIRAYCDKKDVIDYLLENKKAMGEDKYNESLKVVSGPLYNTRPKNIEPYYTYQEEARRKELHLDDDKNKG